MFDYLTQTFGIAGGTLGRISFIVFVIGLLGTKRSHRVILWIIVGLQILTNSILIIILFVQCPGHASAIWNQNGKDKCWDVRIQAYYGYYQGCTSFHSLPWSTIETNHRLQTALNSATDLYLAVFSTYIFWNLNLKLRVKLGLVVLLGLGILWVISLGPYLKRRDRSNMLSQIQCNGSLCHESSTNPSPCTRRQWSNRRNRQLRSLAIHRSLFSHHYGLDTLY